MHSSGHGSLLVRNCCVRWFVNFSTSGHVFRRRVESMKKSVNARDRWLASFASENTRVLYEKVLGMFWDFAQSRYSAPSSADPYTWLMKHRHDEVKKHSPDPLHCERIVSEWYESLASTDLDPSSATTYRAVVNAIFARLLPRNSGSLRLPLEPSDDMS